MTRTDVTHTEVLRQAFDLRPVIDDLPRAIIVTSLAGEVLLWNRRAEALYGWSEAEVLGRAARDVVGAADDRDRNAALAAVRAGGTWTGDRTVMTREGRCLRVSAFVCALSDESGELVGLISATEDVTDQRIAEQQQRDLTEHFRVALDAGGLGTWRWDMATGEVVWDARLEALFGLPEGSFDGTFETYEALLHPSDRDEVLSVMREAVGSKQPYRIEHRVRWPDGSVHWLGAAGSVTLDEHGAATGTIGCVGEITDRVAQQQERDRRAAVATVTAEAEGAQRERLQYLASIYDALNAATSVEEIMAEVTRAAVPRLGDWCAIHVLRPGAPVPDKEVAHIDPELVAYARMLQERYPYDPTATTGIPAVIRDGTVEFHREIDDALLDALELDEELRGVVARLALRSSIAVPIVKRDRVLGAMQFVLSDPVRRYSEDDVALAQLVAARVAVSLENRRLSDEQRRISETLQRSLLPDTLPEIPGMDTAVRYWAAGEVPEVGGDFYDVFEIDDDCWGLVIGDVCGTGPSAAAITGLARHCVREAAWHGDPPTEVLASLNRAVLRSGAGMFCTAIFGQLRRSGDAMMLTFACGGHPLPVLVRGGVARTVGHPGTLLGSFPTIATHEHSIDLGGDDVVLLYTDGATDVAPPHLLTAGEFRALVGRAVRHADQPSADAIADRVQAELQAELPFAARPDDIALLVLSAQR
jgi:PAS domain S-box-containing protein